MKVVCKLLVLICCTLSSYGKLNPNKFPADFLFGTATAAYQIEGAWNISGKGENIWDRYVHTNPKLITDSSNGDVACDSYHKFKEDIALLKNVGVQFYRFSLSWSRILPTGFAYQINPDGIRYYNDVINLLIENDIIPLVTLFHWDTPQPLQDLGGFTNELMVEWFEDYARVVFENFGDRVTTWITFNEPKQICSKGYGTKDLAPGIDSSGIGDYLCAHNLIKAHARAYHLYDKEFKSQQNGRISITIDCQWMEPKTNSTADKDAAERARIFSFAWYADPIYGRKGDYPEVMKKFIAERSEKEGFKKSRLPKFTKTEIKYINGTYDFFGLNHYTTFLIENTVDAPIGGKPSLFNKDVRALLSQDPSWPRGTSDWLSVVPWGFTNTLRWIQNRYGDIPIIVTEGGFSDHGELDDQGRINYFQLYLSALLDAMHTYNVNVKGYAFWSLLDNFEWMDGYTNRFGLHHVDFDDPERTRVPKASVEYLKTVITNRTIV